jgi:hypothetical protein
MTDFEEVVARAEEHDDSHLRDPTPATLPGWWG